MSLSVKDAIAKAEALVELIDDDVPESAHDKAGEFFEDIRQKAVDIGATIERLDRVTENQLRALDNWEAAVRKWIHD